MSDDGTVVVRGAEPSGNLICNLAFAELLFAAAGTVEGPLADAVSVGGGRPARNLYDNTIHINETRYV